jgi:hypothetical protein
MGTRANLIVRRGPQDYAMIYTHWDGYPSGNGVLLDRFHNSYEAALEIVRNGDLSSLHERITPFPGEKHTFDEAAPFCTTFYGRDRGESGTEARSYETLEEAIRNADNEYVYVWMDGVGGWFFAPVGEDTLGALRALRPFIEKDDECQANVARYDAVGMTQEWRARGCPHIVVTGTYSPHVYSVPLNPDGTVPETFTRLEDGVEETYPVQTVQAAEPKESPAPKKRKVATKAEKRGFAYENAGAWA